MKFAVEVIFPYAAAYARHAGVKIGESELRAELAERAAGLPWWGLFLAVKGAVAVRIFYPYIFLRKPCFFEDLSADEKDLLLQRLQFSRFLPVKGLFVALKSLVVTACYGTEMQMKKIGYK